MKNVLKILNILTIILIITNCFTGCVFGVISEDQYCELFDGVYCLDENGNIVYYQMRTLVDNIEFNTNIISKPYCKLDIYLKQSCQIKGIVFIVRSSKNCSLKFTTYLNNEFIKTNTKEITSEGITDIELIFGNSVLCNLDTEFYIEIEELNKQEDEEKTSFQFDSLIIFLQE